MSLCDNCPIPYEECLPEDEDCAVIAMKKNLVFLMMNQMII